MDDGGSHDGDERDLKQQQKKQRHVGRKPVRRLKAREAITALLNLGGVLAVLDEASVLAVDEPGQKSVRGHEDDDSTSDRRHGSHVRPLLLSRLH